jgi:transcriptional regulator with XRE-family HTH domain
LERTKEWRESRGFTQRELAAAAGVGESTIARVELGASVVPTTARKISGVLEVSVADLMGDPPTTAVAELVGEKEPALPLAEASEKGPQPDYEVVYPARSYTPETREKVMAEAQEVAREAKQDYDPNTPWRIVLVDDGETIEVRAEPVSSPSLRAQRNRRATRRP